jgi:Concanavalin A-like lectin/glucanases superfamily
MVLPATGYVSLRSIIAEFAGTSSNLSDYYLGGSFVTSTNASVPTKASGAKISLSQFYGAGTLSPSNVRVTSFTPDTLNIAWNPTSNAVGYTVKEATVMPVGSNTTSTSFTASNLIPFGGSTLSFFVTSYNSNNVYSIVSTSPLTYAVPFSYIVHLDATTITGVALNAVVSTWIGIDGTLNATGYNGPTLINSEKNKPCVRFNIASSQYFQFPALTFKLSTGLSSVTVCKRTARSNFSRVYDMGNGPNSNNFILSWPFTADDMSAQLFNGNLMLINNHATAPFSQWMVIITSYNKAANTLSLYVNGILQGTPMAVSATWLELTLSTNYVGRSNWNVDSYVDMELGELIIVSKALSPSDVTSINTQMTSKWLL